ncbi:MAG: hypothetical protein VXZ18_19270, partial [Pseudomonadota bacterium]|nr:hypothetical protein [Pseudomonadota bacterium]
MHYFTTTTTTTTTTSVSERNDSLENKSSKEPPPGLPQIIHRDLNFHEKTRHQRRGAFCLVRLEWSTSSQIITVHVAFLACKPMARKATIEHLR